MNHFRVRRDLCKQVRLSPLLHRCVLRCFSLETKHLNDRIAVPHSHSFSPPEMNFSNNISPTAHNPSTKTDNSDNDNDKSTDQSDESRLQQTETKIKENNKKNKTRNKRGIDNNNTKSQTLATATSGMPTSAQQAPSKNGIATKQIESKSPSSLFSYDYYRQRVIDEILERQLNDQHYWVPFSTIASKLNPIFVKILSNPKFTQRGFATTAQQRKNLNIFTYEESLDNITKYLNLWGIDYIVKNTTTPQKSHKNTATPTAAPANVVRKDAINDLFVRIDMDKHNVYSHLLELHQGHEKREKSKSNNNRTASKLVHKKSAHDNNNAYVGRNFKQNELEWVNYEFSHLVPIFMTQIALQCNATNSDSIKCRDLMKWVNRTFRRFRYNINSNTDARNRNTNRNINRNTRNEKGQENMEYDMMAKNFDFAPENVIAFLQSHHYFVLKPKIPEISQKSAKQTTRNHENKNENENKNQDDKQKQQQVSLSELYIGIEPNLYAQIQPYLSRMTKRYTTENDKQRNRQKQKQPQQRQQGKATSQTQNKNEEKQQNEPQFQSIMQERRNSSRTLPDEFRRVIGRLSKNRFYDTVCLMYQMFGNFEHKLDDDIEQQIKLLQATPTPDFFTGNSVAAQKNAGNEPNLIDFGGFDDLDPLSVAHQAAPAVRTQAVDNNSNSNEQDNTTELVETTIDETNDVLVSNNHKTEKLLHIDINMLHFLKKFGLLPYNMHEAMNKLQEIKFDSNEPGMYCFHPNYDRNININININSGTRSDSWIVKNLLQSTNDLKLLILPANIYRFITNKKDLLRMMDEQKTRIGFGVGNISINNYSIIDCFEKGYYFSLNKNHLLNNRRDWKKYPTNFELIGIVSEDVNYRRILHLMFCDLIRSLPSDMIPIDNELNVLTWISGVLNGLEFEIFGQTGQLKNNKRNKKTQTSALGNKSDSKNDGNDGSDGNNSDHNSLAFIEQYRDLLRNIMSSRIRESLIEKHKMIVNRIAKIYLSDNMPLKFLYQDWFWIAKLCPILPDTGDNSSYSSINANYGLSSSGYSQNRPEYSLTFIKQVIAKMLQYLNSASNSSLSDDRLRINESDFLLQIKRLMHDKRFIIRLGEAMNHDNESYLHFIETLMFEINSNDNDNNSYIIDNETIHLFMEYVLLPSKDLFTAFSLLKMMISNQVLSLQINDKTLHLFMRICEVSNNVNMMYQVYDKLINTMPLMVNENSSIIEPILRLFIKHKEFDLIENVIVNITYHYHYHHYVPKTSQISNTQQDNTSSIAISTNDSNYVPIYQLKHCQVLKECYYPVFNLIAELSNVAGMDMNNDDDDEGKEQTQDQVNPMIMRLESLKELFVECLENSHQNKNGFNELMNDLCDEYRDSNTNEAKIKVMNKMKLFDQMSRHANNNKWLLMQWNRLVKNLTVQ